MRRERVDASHRPAPTALRGAEDPWRGYGGRVRRRLLVILLLGLVGLFGGRLVLLTAAAGTPDAAQARELPALKAGQHRVAIVFGAGLRDGKPSRLLLDRIRAAEKLLEAGTVDLLLMTGDNSQPGYDEPGAMLQQARDDGVAADRIAVDYGGRRTWDSCLRAREVFGVREAVVVTNDFHRARTVETCQAAGLRVAGAVGTSTKGYDFAPRMKWQARELLASWRGVLDAWIRHPDVAVGGKPVDVRDPCSVWRSLSAEDRGARPGGC